MPHWSSGLPVASRHEGPRFKSPGGYLCKTGIILLALSRYTTVIKMIAQYLKMILKKQQPKISKLILSLFFNNRSLFSPHNSDQQQVIYKTED
jgi:hypothetical protein